MMRSASAISIGLHGAALAILLSAALGKSVSVPVPPPGVMVTLATLPAFKPSPAPQPTPPQPAVTQPNATTAKPAVAKPAVKPAPKPAAKVLVPSPAALAAPTPATAPAATLTPASEATIAPTPAAPAAPPSPTATPESLWLGQVRAKLEAVKRYPPAAARRRDQGITIITFEIAPDGRVLTHGISQSSGSSLLDREAEDLPERASPLPPMPDGMVPRRITLTLPVSFTLR